MAEHISACPLGSLVLCFSNYGFKIAFRISKGIGKPSGTRNVNVCCTIIWLDESFGFLCRSCPSGSVIQRIAGSGRGRTHLRGGEGGCLTERCRAPQDGHSPLHLSAQHGHSAMVEQLLAAGAAVDTQNEVRGVGGGG